MSWKNFWNLDGVMLGKDGKVSESGQRERDAQIYGPIVGAPVELASGAGAVTGDGV